MRERPYHEQKKKNMELSLQDQQERPMVCRAMPVKITMNNTHKCNLGCPLCFKQFEPGHNMSYADMPIEVFRTVAEDVFAYVDEVGLSVSGEPLISPNIEEELEVGARFGVHVTITTNGVPLGVKRLRDLVLKHVYAVHLSMDASCKETFERIRAGARWEQVMGSLEELLKEREEQGYGPKVFTNFLMMRENIEELPEWVALMAEAGVDGCFAEHVVVPGAFAIMSLVNHKRLAMEKMNEARAVAEKCGMFLKLPPPYLLSPEDEKQPVTSREEIRERLLGTSKGSAPLEDAPLPDEPVVESASHVVADIPNPDEIRALNAQILPGRSVPCPYAWRETWVHQQGEVLCCDTNNFPFQIGLIPKDRITDLWNGEKYQELRKRLVNGEVYTSCRHCHVVGQIDSPEDPLSFVKGMR